MADPLKHRTLLEELDLRQNEVLAQLDELNARVEQLIKECTSRLETPLSAERRAA
ncbi:MAG: hypothetical protein J5I93_11810 [Pirellulaceae bacterium]|nr:hypothetical protein [Pirellulaceae bacterium]